MRKYSVTAVIWKEGRQFVSKCPELGVASYGKTLEKAREALEEAVGLYLENAQALGLIRELKPTLSTSVHYTTSLQIAVA